MGFNPASPNSGGGGSGGGGGMIWRGEYNGTQRYLIGDVVGYDGSSYVCYVENTQAILPTDTDNWELVAQEGLPGAPGALWYSDNGAPDPMLGENGDYYINNLNGDYYRKESGSWSLQGNLTGPQGDPGPGLPAGGTAGQLPVKVNGTDYNVAWASFIPGAGIDIDSTGGDITISSTITQYTDDDAEDAVGALFTDSSTIDFTYTANTSISAIVVDASLVFGKLATSAWSSDPTLGSGSNTVLPTQGAVKNYVDNAISGLKWKQSARVATDVNGTLATAFADGQVVDGVTLATGDRILLKNQTTQTENGIYIVQAAGAPVRSADADTGSELVQATLMIQEGTNWADTQWTCTNNAITIGVTNIVFAQVSAGGTQTADGTTITLTGNVYSVTTNGIGNSQIRQGAACSIIGVSGNALGNVADIVASTNDRLFARTGNALSFVQLTNGMVPTNTVSIDKLAFSATARLGGRTTAGAGAGEEIAVDATMSLAAGSLGVAAGGIGTTQLASGIAPVVSSMNGGQLAGMRNRLINGTCAVNTRNLATVTDNLYCIDRWRALSQTGAVAPAVLGNPTAGIYRAGRLTQSQVTAQRFGFCQPIASANCNDLRTSSGVFSGVVRCSNSTNLRYAVLEWTGTADTAVGDPVNTWTSTTYTAGNFFPSSNYNVLAVSGSIAVTGGTWFSLPGLAAAIGASANNIMVMVWTEGTQAQNTTLDWSLMQFEPGTVATPYEFRLSTMELLLCNAFYYEVTGTLLNVDFSQTSIINYYTVTNFPAPLYKSPTVTMGTVGATLNVQVGYPVLTYFDQGHCRVQVQNAAATRCYCQFTSNHIFDAEI